MAGTSLFERAMLLPAVRDAFIKLDPRTLVRNPVMFTTAIVALVATVILLRHMIVGTGDLAFEAQLIFWLWLTVLFGNFAEALAEGRGKAQAQSLRATKDQLVALRIGKNGATEEVPATQLRQGDVVLVTQGRQIPADGEVVAGVASVNEAAITGESAPVIREAGGDRSAVTAGTTVLSDEIRVKVTAEPGSGFLDRMIALVEGASRQKTPNEIALTILLTGLTLIFLVAVGTLPAFAAYAGGVLSVPVLIALFVALIPTTISGLLSAIGIAGMDRLIRFNVLAKSGRAVEAAGDIGTLLLDKTGTITIGDRQASEFVPLPGVAQADLIAAARMASLSDTTPEGRSIVTLAGNGDALPADAVPVGFTAQTRVSGIDLPRRRIRKGAVDAVLKLGNFPEDIVRALRKITDRIAQAGGKRRFPLLDPAPGDGIERRAVGPPLCHGQCRGAVPAGLQRRAQGDSLFPRPEIRRRPTRLAVRLVDGETARGQRLGILRRVVVAGEDHAAILARFQPRQAIAEGADQRDAPVQPGAIGQAAGLAQNQLRMLPPLPQPDLAAKGFGRGDTLGGQRAADRRPQRIMCRRGFGPVIHRQRSQHHSRRAATRCRARAESRSLTPSRFATSRISASSSASRWPSASATSHIASSSSVRSS